MWPFSLEKASKQAIAEVIECATTPAHQLLPFGRLRSSRLKVRGWLQPVELDGNGRTAMPRRRTSRYDASIDIQLDRTLTSTRAIQGDGERGVQSGASRW